MCGWGEWILYAALLIFKMFTILNISSLTFAFHSGEESGVRKVERFYSQYSFYDSRTSGAVAAAAAASAGERTNTSFE